MDKPLKIHITFLEAHLKELNQKLMDETRSRAERNQIESEIRAAQLALSYYRQALELEQQLGK
jgi:hypothetical protein